MSGGGWPDQDERRRRLVEQQPTKKERKSLCPCLCHDMGGGPAHPGERCKCNSGTGMDGIVACYVTPIDAPEILYDYGRSRDQAYYRVLEVEHYTASLLARIKELGETCDRLEADCLGYATETRELGVELRMIEGYEKNANKVGTDFANRLAKMASDMHIIFERDKPPDKSEPAPLEKRDATIHELEEMVNAEEYRHQETSIALAAERKRREEDAENSQRNEIRHQTRAAKAEARLAEVEKELAASSKAVMAWIKSYRTWERALREEIAKSAALRARVEVLEKAAADYLISHGPCTDTECCDEDATCTDPDCHYCALARAAQPDFYRFRDYPEEAPTPVPRHICPCRDSDNCKCGCHIFDTTNNGSEKP